MANRGLLFLFFLTSGSLFSQSVIRGLLTADSVKVAGVTVMNLVSEEVTVCDASGRFSILAREDDLLIFSAVNFEYKRRQIDRSDIEKGEISVKLTPKVEQLDEVVVLRDIDPESLGIVPKGQKKYTPAERRLKTASDANFKWFLFPVPVVTFSLDPVFNSISGRTKKLKKELVVEQKERYLQLLDENFDSEYLTSALKIPQEYQDGFRFFAVQDDAFTSVLTGGTHKNAEKLLAQLAISYTTLIADETP